MVSLGNTKRLPPNKMTTFSLAGRGDRSRRDPGSQCPVHEKRFGGYRRRPDSRAHSVCRSWCRDGLDHGAILDSSWRQRCVDRTRHEDRERVSRRCCKLRGSSVDGNAGSGCDGRSIGASFHYIAHSVASCHASNALCAMGSKSRHSLLWIDTARLASFDDETSWQWNEVRLE